MRKLTLAVLLYTISSMTVSANMNDEVLSKEAAPHSMISTDVPKTVRKEENTTADRLQIESEIKSEDRKPITISGGSYAKTTSIMEFLELGMVPVEDIEAKLLQLGKASTSKPSKGKIKGKFYVINASGKASEAENCFIDKDDDDDEEEEEEEDDDEDEEQKKKDKGKKKKER